MKRIAHGSVCMLLVLLTGCATIIDGGEKSVGFKSTPDGAKVTVFNKRTGESVVTGITPAVLTLKRKSGYFDNAEYRVVIEKDGFKPYELEVHSSFNAWYIGNLVFGGLLGIVVIDPWTGAMWTFSPKDYNVQLSPKDSASVEPALKVLLMSDLTPEQRKHLVPLNPAQK